MMTNIVHMVQESTGQECFSAFSTDWIGDQETNTSSTAQCPFFVKLYNNFRTIPELLIQMPPSTPEQIHTRNTHIKTVVSNKLLKWSGTFTLRQSLFYTFYLFSHRNCACRIRGNWQSCFPGTGMRLQRGDLIQHTFHRGSSGWLLHPQKGLFG